MKFGPLIKIVLVINSIFLVGLLIAYRTGYLNLPFLPSRMNSGIAANNDNGQLPNGTLIESSKSGPAVDATNSAPRVSGPAIDSNDMMLSSKSGLAVGDTGTSVLALDVDSDEKTAAPATRPSWVPAAQP